MKLSLVLFASAAAIGAQANVVSDFASGIDGWTSARVDPYSLTLLGMGTPGWNPGGYLDTIEDPGGLFLLSAAPKFLGAKSSYLGGTVSFDLSDATHDPGSTLGFFLVKADGSLALGYRMAPPAAFPGSSYSVPLTQDGNWVRFDGTPTGTMASNADLQSALSALGFMGVNADWTTTSNPATDPPDHTTLDNVVLATPVPEPSIFAAFALGAVTLIRRRHRAL